MAKEKNLKMKGGKNSKNLAEEKSAKNLAEEKTLGSGKEKVSKELQEMIACADCKGNLNYTLKGNFLTCQACSIKYKIINGIPIMLLDKKK